MNKNLFDLKKRANLFIIFSLLYCVYLFIIRVFCQFSQSFFFNMENSYVPMLFYSSLEYLPLIIIIYFNIGAVRKFCFSYKVLTLVLLAMYMITCILQKPQFDSYINTFVFSFINLFIVAGIEELFYRGILFTELKNEKGVYFAYTTSTILFIVAHVNAFIDAGSSMAFLYLASIIIMTLWFAFIFNKTNSIFIVILFHGLANLNNILVYFLILISIMILIVKSYFTNIKM